jgi:DNA-directed RNA polymerase alpha subunit
MSGKTEKRHPFHETIVNAIREATRDQMEILAALMKSTIITKNHEVIIAAWERRVIDFGIGDDFGVTGALAEQKEAAAPEDETAISSFNNSVLGRSVEELELNVRAYIFVTKANLKTFRDLITMTESEMLNYPDSPASPAVVTEISEVVRGFGFSLGMLSAPKRHVNGVVHMKHRIQTA